jgi:hypothetical protein
VIGQLQTAVLCRTVSRLQTPRVTPRTLNTDSRTLYLTKCGAHGGPARSRTSNVQRADLLTQVKWPERRCHNPLPSTVCHKSHIWRARARAHTHTHTHMSLFPQINIPLYIFVGNCNKIHRKLFLNKTRRRPISILQATTKPV